MNLYNCFTHDQRNFLYYSIDDNQRVDPISKPQDSWKFIQNYFKHGGKYKAFDVSFAKSLRESGRHIHTVSMYYIGCLLSKMIEQYLTITFQELIPGLTDFNYRFTYTWFLTCLYHDTAYIIEDKLNLKEIEIEGEPRFLLNKNLKQHNVKHDVYEHKC